ncbi:MAG: hypothetical protein IIB03_01035, partial [Acidobacteria bacterium]|nr:hypothetical protein [Acidobacteriota bacterium]
MLVPIDLILVIAMDDFTFRIKDKGKIEVAVRVQLRISSPALPDDK